jgi:hypothetical protein
MSRQFWQEALIWTTADATAVANTTTETALFSAPTIPANYLQDGRTLRLRAIGKYSTTATPTMIFGLRYGTATGGVVLCKTAACTTPSGVTNAMWDLDVLMTVRSNGSTGTLMANGTARLFAAVAGTVASATGEGLVTPMTNGGVVTPAAATCDFTADTALNLTLTWSAASASNTATGLNYLLESLN